MAKGKTLNRIYHEKNKVRVAGRGAKLKGFTPKQVAELVKKSEVNEKSKGGKGRPRRP